VSAVRRTGIADYIGVLQGGTKHTKKSLFAVAAAIVLLTALTRLPALLHPRPISDEAVYSVVGMEILDGGHPYVDAVERKPPLLFWTYASVFGLFGHYNIRALHAVALLWVLGTMGGLYVIGRNSFDRATGLAAALLYSVFQPWATSENDNLAFNGEMLMNLPLVWAYAIAFRRGASRIELLAAGALLAAATLLKQPAAIAAVPFGIYLLLARSDNEREPAVLTRFADAAMLVAGFTIALAIVGAVLFRQGILRDAVYWSVGDHSIVHVFWRKGVSHTLQFIGICSPLIAGAAVAVWDRSRTWRRRQNERTALLLLVAGSAIGTCAGARFYPHYYIQLIPPLALLAAPHYARVWSGETRGKRQRFLLSLSCFSLFVAAGWFLFVHSRGLASKRQPLETARFLSEHSAPDDRIFVWGHKAAIYIDAQRRPACRYILTFPLTGYIFGGPIPGVDTRNRILPDAWNHLQEDFGKHPPVYVIDVQDEDNLVYPIRDFPVLAKLLASYNVVARNDEAVIYSRR
jgi:4-amino-4-deoxy-L-arabinose transferase-like glycosyltransferase